TYAATFSLHKYGSFADVFGPLPTKQASYLFTVRGLWRLVGILDEARSAPQSVRSVEARRALGLAEDDLTRIGAEPPALPSATGAWGVAVEYTDQLLNTVTSSPVTSA
ncbi:MAG: hypothetical protein HKO63_06715, partial [Acidimicrobiia bacterium]|nr:hypothetical protein [Acidimicrobiia bacterium]